MGCSNSRYILSEFYFKKMFDPASIGLGKSKGRFTRHNFVACDKLTTRLRHESFRVNQTYNLLTIVAYDTKNVVGF